MRIIGDIKPGSSRHTDEEFDLLMRWARTDPGPRTDRAVVELVKFVGVTFGLTFGLAIMVSTLIGW